MGAAMKFVMWCLQPALRRISHLKRNSKQVRDALVGRPFSPALKFMKVDKEDYYLSGLHEDFIRASINVVDPQWQHMYGILLKSLLSNQYITDGQHLYRIVVGAGMGVSYAGDLCDITFH